MMFSLITDVAVCAFLAFDILITLSITFSDEFSDDVQSDYGRRGK